MPGVALVVGANSLALALNDSQAERFFVWVSKEGSSSEVPFYGVEKACFSYPLIGLLITCQLHGVTMSQMKQPSTVQQDSQLVVMSLKMDRHEMPA